ncbi:hypothetical protein EPr2_0066 [Providencia phage EPr2]|uniref:Uncharacterized protein n=2 Tax=Providencia phage EPr2 TaxID=2917333 RepID=A0AC61TTA9_9CAUD|nr:hypothetical protein EPr2_0003 [Providencia phage EPr2]UNI71174.1 hypothetical protein EPr2_0066 [Providencia phage EPr2]
MTTVAKVSRVASAMN